MKSGFASQTFDSQKVFRTLLDAMASPGEIMTLDVDIDFQEPAHYASGAILLTLMDFETPFWTDLESRNDAVHWLRFHTGAPLPFGLGDSHMPVGWGSLPIKEILEILLPQYTKLFMMELRSRYFQDIPTSKTNLARILSEVMGS
jgi:hypothetical protein